VFLHKRDNESACTRGGVSDAMSRLQNDDGWVRSTLQASCERRWLDCSVWTHVRRVVMANGCQPRGASGEERLPYPATGRRSSSKHQQQQRPSCTHHLLLRQRNGGYRIVNWQPECWQAVSPISSGSNYTAMAEPRQASKDVS